MANVSFLTGSQSKLDSLNSFIAGAFYLTSDTDRLYFAQSASELVRLNRHVVQVANIASLPKTSDVATGDFYYAIAENILCTYVDGAWQQINPNTNTESYVSSVTSKVENTGTLGTDGAIKITLTVAQDRYNQITGDELDDDGKSPLGTTDRTVTFNITEAELYKVIHKPVVDVGASVSDAGVATVKTSGHGSSGDGFNVKGQDGITVKTDGSDGFIIDGTTYHLNNYKGNTTTPESKVRLKDSDGNDEAVYFEVEGNRAVSGTTGNNLIITPGDNKIDISHTTLEPTVDSDGNNLSGNTYAQTFTYIKDPTFDEGGHVSGYSTGTIQLPVEQDYEITEVGADNTGKITVIIKDKTNSGNQSSFTSDADLHYTVGAEGSAYRRTVYNQGDLNVYTIPEVDAKLQAANAMRYRGTIESQDDLDAKTSVQIGDVYKIIKAGEYDVSVNGTPVKSHYCDVGDLVIAVGSLTDPDAGEGTSGLTSVIWTYVPSGDDTDTQYTYYLVDGTDYVDTHLLDSTKIVGNQTIRFAEGAKLEVEGTAATDDAPATITYSHSEIDTEITSDADAAAANTTPLAPKSKITVVTGVQADGYGHITDVTRTQYTLPDEREYSLALNTTTANAPTIQLLENDDDSTNEVISNVKFTVGTKNASLEVAGDSTNKVVTYSHKHFGDTVTTESADDVIYSTVKSEGLYAITGVTVENGHLTKVEKTPVKVRVSDVTDFTINAAASNNVVTMTHTITQSNSEQSSLIDKYNIKTATTSMVLGATAATTSADAAISIDLVWQSF